MQNMLSQNLRSHILESLLNKENFVMYKLSKIVIYFYSEKNVYPFAVKEEIKKMENLLNKHYTAVLIHIQGHGYLRQNT